MTQDSHFGNFGTLGPTATNQRAGGKGEMTLLLHILRCWLALPHHDRSAIQPRVFSDQQEKDLQRKQLDNSVFAEVPGARDA